VKSKPRIKKDRRDPASPLPSLSSEFYSDRATVLSSDQIERFVKPLYKRTWKFTVTFNHDIMEDEEPVPVLRKAFRFGTESALAGWVTQMLSYMQDVQHHARLNIQHKRVVLTTYTHEAFRNSNYDEILTSVSTKDVQLAFHAERLFEAALEGGPEAYRPLVTRYQPTSFAELAPVQERLQLFQRVAHGARNHERMLLLNKHKTMGAALSLEDNLTVASGVLGAFTSLSSTTNKSSSAAEPGEKIASGSS